MSARRKFCSGGGGGIRKKAPHKYKKGLPHAEKLAKNILLKYSYTFASEKVLRKCNPKRTNLHNKQTFRGVCSNVPLNIVRSNTISLIYIKMNIFTIFFYKIVAKYTPEHMKLHHLIFFRGSMPPNPLAYKWLRHALHGTERYANRLTFHKLT